MANHLDNIFYTSPSTARKTMTAAHLREALLHHDTGLVFAQGWAWEIVAKTMGAGVYLVTLKKAHMAPTAKRLA